MQKVAELLVKNCPKCEDEEKAKKEKRKRTLGVWYFTAVCLFSFGTFVTGLTASVAFVTMFRLENKDETCRPMFFSHWSLALILFWFDVVLLLFKACADKEVPVLLDKIGGTINAFLCMFLAVSSSHPLCDGLDKPLYRTMPLIQALCGILYAVWTIATCIKQRLADRKEERRWTRLMRKGMETQMKIQVCPKCQKVKSVKKKKEKKPIKKNYGWRLVSFFVAAMGFVGSFSMTLLTYGELGSFRWSQCGLRLILVTIAGHLIASIEIVAAVACFSRRVYEVYEPAKKVVQNGVAAIVYISIASLVRLTPCMNGGWWPVPMGVWGPQLLLASGLVYAVLSAAFWIKKKWEASKAEESGLRVSKLVIGKVKGIGKKMRVKCRSDRKTKKEVKTKKDVESKKDVTQIV